MTGRIYTVGGIVLAAILVLALNVLAGNGLRSARLDLTQEGLFTLSEGSHNVLAGLDEPITLRFYFSAKLANQVPQIKTYGQRVREMLEEYANISGGKIKLQVIDPVPFTDDEDDAVRQGLQALPLTGGDNLYFGLVGTNTVDDRQVVTFFQQQKEQFLEYDLTRLIYNLADPKKPVVGLITGHQMNADVSPLMTVQGRGPQVWAIVDQIRETFELKTLYPRDNKIPDDIDILLIVHPGKLADSYLYAIDQFVMRGGRVVLYVDPFSEVASAFRQQQQRGQVIEDFSEFKKLLASWGGEVEEGKFVGDWNQARQVNVGIPGRIKIMRYLGWLALGPQNYNADDVITADLGPINLATAGYIRPLEGATTKLTPLLRIGPKSGLFDADLIRLGPNPQNLIDNYKPTEEEYVIAARLTGKVASAFPDGPPPEPEKDAAKAAGDDAAKDKERQADENAVPPHLTESQRDINIVVVADADMLFDQFWASQQDFFGKKYLVANASNGDMLINALDNLAGSEDLVGLRSRGRSERRFEVMSQLRQEAERQFLERERELANTLKETKDRLNDLQGKTSAGGGALISKQQEAEIEKAQADIRATRRQLRDVQHDLNKDIEGLETKLKFANIGLVPILVALIALVLTAVRYRRRRRSMRQPARG